MRNKYRVYTAACLKNGLQRPGLPQNHLPCRAPWAPGRASYDATRDTHTTLPLYSGLNTKHDTTAPTRW